MSYIYLEGNQVSLLSASMQPHFLGLQQQALVNVCDALGSIVKADVQIDLNNLYDFRSAILSTQGASQVGITDLGNHYSGSTVESALQQVGQSLANPPAVAHSSLSGLSADDHPQYLNTTRGDARYTQAGHTHTIGNVTGLQAALDGKAAASHTHAISEVTNLQASLDAKLNSSAFTWANLGSKPTTVAGFGITDAVTTGTSQNITGAKTFTSIVTSSQYFQVTGASAGFRFEDRSTPADNWVWYATGGISRLFSPNNEDVLLVNKTTRVASDFFGKIRGIPVIVTNATHSFLASDAGMARVKTDTSAYTWTVPNNTLSAGDALSIVNAGSAGNVTIQQGTGFTLTLAGAGTTGNRTLSPNSIATIFIVTPSSGLISGSGVS